MATEDELAEVRNRLLGMIDEARITTTLVDRPAPEVVDAFLATTDLCSTVSDALDGLGVGGAIPASRLVPVIEGARVVGPAITLRYEPVGGSVGARHYRNDRPLLADRDLYGVGKPGDVAVLSSASGPHVSVMGGMSARWARATGIAACVVDGGVRDISTIRSLEHLVWSRGRTPITGRHRVEAVEINGTISIDGVQVRPGDLIVADDTGVCVVPRSNIAEVLERCRRDSSKEAAISRMFAEGKAIEEIVATFPADRW